MKRLACMFGRHKWETHIEQGESYKVCSVCGKPPQKGGKPPTTDTDLFWSKVGSGGGGG
jgi:hypothetical protein